jgi:hypothetical protein
MAPLTSNILLLALRAHFVRPKLLLQFCQSALLPATKIPPSASPDLYGGRAVSCGEPVRRGYATKKAAGIASGFLVPAV